MAIEYPSAHLKEAALRVKRASECIVSLLVPVAGHCGSSIEDVFHITGYEGQDMLESTLAMSVQSVEQWQVLVDETLKTAAKTKQLASSWRTVQKLTKPSGKHSHSSTTTRPFSVRVPLDPSKSCCQTG